MAEKKLALKITAKDNASHAVKGLRGEVSKTTEELKKNLKVAMKWGAGVATAIGVGMVKAGNDIENATATIIKGTGATGEELEKMVAMSREIASEVPQSLDEVSDAVQGLRTRLEVSGKELEGMSREFLDFARISNIEVSTAVRNVTRVMGDWGLEASDATSVMNKLTVIAQASGAEIGDLTNMAVEYGVQFRAVGFEIDEVIAMLGKFEKEGVATRKMMGGLSMALGRMAQEGYEPREEFGRLIERIQTATNEGEAMRESISLLGTRAGPDFALAVREGRFELEDYMAMLQDTSGALVDTAERSRTAGDEIKALKDAFFNAIAPTDEMTGTLKEIIVTAREWLNENKELVSNIVLVTGAVAGLTVAIGALTLALGAILSPIGLVVVALGSLGAAYGYVHMEQKRVSDLMQAGVERHKEVAQSYRDVAASMPDFAGQAEQVARLNEATAEIINLNKQRAAIQEKLANTQVWEVEKINRLKEEESAIESLIKTKEKEREESAKLAKGMADDRAEALGEDFRNFTKFKDLREQLTEEEFKTTYEYLKENVDMSSDMREAILKGDVKLTKDKVALLDVVAKNNLKTSNAITKITAEQANERLGIAKQQAINEADLIQRLLEYNAEAGNDELRLYSEKLTKESSLSAKFKSDLASMFNTPIIQEIKAVFTDEDTNLISKVNNAVGLMKNRFINAGGRAMQYKASLSALNSEFDSSVEKIQATNTELEELGGDAIGGAGGGGGGASSLGDDLEKLQGELADTAESYNRLNQEAGSKIADLKARHVEAIENMDVKLQDLRGSLEELQTAYDIQTQGFDQSLAQKVVEQEKLVADLRRDMMTQTDTEGGGDAVARYLKEKQALEDFMGSAQGLEEELAEARRRASLTDFERFVEDIEMKKEKALIEFEEKKRQLQEEMALVQLQKDNEIQAYEEKIAEYEKVKKAFAKYEERLREGMTNSAAITQAKVSEMIAALKALEAQMNRVGVASVATLTGNSGVANNTQNTNVTNNININVNGSTSDPSTVSEIEEAVVRSIQLQQVNSV